LENRRAFPRRTTHCRPFCGGGSFRWVRAHHQTPASFPINERAQLEGETVDGLDPVMLLDGDEVPDDESLQTPKLFTTLVLAEAEIHPGHLSDPVQNIKNH